jgi:hypothetical protein
MNFGSQRAIVGSLMVAVCFGWFSPTACWAQKRYKDPYADKVKKIADKAARFLESNKGGGREGPICALAVLEYYKRYEGVVPTDNPYVSSTVARVAGMVDSGSAEVLDNRETYFPATALILLAEYDAKKYKPQIMKILDTLVDRQISNGAFTYKGESNGDTSQSQFGALAFFVARQHRIPLDPKHVKHLLQFYVDYQAGNGTWAYKPKSPGQGSVGGTNSLHSASLSSVYLLADMLRLSKRVKNMTSLSADSSLGLPKNVTVYVPPTDDKEGNLQAAWGDGVSPVVKFERGKLSSCKSSGNSWYSSQFQFPINQWNSYFMYALERYAYFKEQADGNLGSALSSWYDDGVDYIEEFQSDSGAVEGHRRVPNMPVNVNTALSLLFLVRASEIISLPPTGSELLGGEGFDSGTLTQSKTGTIASSEAEKSLKGLIDSLTDDTLDDRQLQQITAAMKRAVREFKSKGKRSRGEITSFLKTMISEKNYYRRLVAIRFLSGEQDMDNVPALLYAMGDPDPTIAILAHNGLRLVSRKFETFTFEDKGNKQDNLLELARLKQQWTKWYLELRPNAELLE